MMRLRLMCWSAAGAEEAASQGDIPQDGTLSSTLLDVFTHQAAQDDSLSVINW